ncbi:protein-L-isoaspartate O-methyltransferase [Mesorhizobium sp. Z1-4]|uniref:protein-L-isoaspartate O-methyltransferase family protein n=1 Tax=Mesorhizobium sp. Z1-4 TaxID=2448478 RepID=UPI000FDBFC60|nr:protein-L-isoaspartate O-methyltransferase [Mesorhizobium sp. Z1-4]
MSGDFEQRRVKMVDGQLRTTDVTSASVLDAMLSVPREEFVPRSRAELAYIDEDILVADAASDAPARYLMEPSPFAKLVQLAEIESGDFVLDIGCTTGYSSAVLSQLASSVIALECDEGLAATATGKLTELGYDNVAVVTGALQAGCPDEAPFDVIIVEGAVDQVPDELLLQLRDGGRLVAVVGNGNAGAAHVFYNAEGVISGRKAFNAAVRPLPGFQQVAEFQF